MASRFWVGGTGTWDASDTTHWAASSGGAGGQSVPGASDTVTLDASSGGGTVTLAYSPTVTSITCGAFTGTLDFATYSPTLTTFSGTGTGVRTILLGTGTFTMSGNVDFTTTTNLTFSAGSSTINFVGGSPSFGMSFLTWNNVTWTSGSGGVTFNGNNWVINNLTLNSGTGLRNFQFGGNGTISGVLTVTGLNVGLNRNKLLSTVRGSTRTITMGASSSYVLTNVDFEDMAFTGTGTPISGTSIGDCLGNSGITFTPAVTRYWVGNGGLFSETSHWATSSGGSSGASVPLPQDSWYCDANSFTTTGQTLTLDRYNFGLNADFTGLAYPITLKNNNQSSNGCGCYGNLTLSANSVPSVTGHGGTVPDWKFYSRTNWTLKSAGNTFPVNASGVTFLGPGGVCQLQDAFVTTGYLNANTGGINTNDYNVSCTSFTSTSANTRTVNLGASTVTLSGTGTIFDVGTTTGLTLTASSARFNITDTSSSTKTFQTGGAGGATSIGTVVVTPGGTGSVIFTQSSNTSFVGITCTGGSKTLNFTATKTYTITNWNVSGLPGSPVSIISSSGGSAATISVASGIVSSEWLSLKDSTATGGATFYAGANSTNVSGNTGWIFTGSGNRIRPYGKVALSKQNLLLRSQEFDNASWTKTGGATVTANTIIAPDGTSTADRLNDAIATNSFSVQQTATVTLNSKYVTASVYAKAGTKSWMYFAVNSATWDCYFNLSAGTIGAKNSNVLAQMTSVGNGWYRCSLSYIPTADGNVRFYIVNGNSPSFSYTGDGTGNIYLWGAQMTYTKVPASYVSTTSAAVNSAGGTRELIFPSTAATGSFTISDYTKLAGLPSVATITITDYTAMGGGNFNIGSGMLILTEGVDFNAVTSNSVTATNVANAVNAAFGPICTTLANVVTVSVPNGSAEGATIVWSKTGVSPTTATLLGGNDVSKITVGSINGNFDSEIPVGSSNTAAASNLSSWINSNSSQVTASSSNGVVSVRALSSGASGNSIATTVTGGGGNTPAGSSAGAATLTGGVDGSNPHSALAFKQNLLTYSQDFSNAIWTKTNGSVAANSTIAPDGTVTADTFTPSSGSATHKIGQGINASNDRRYQTVTIFAKPNGYNWLAVASAGYLASVNVSTGVKGSTSGTGSVQVTASTNGFYRIDITMLAAGGTAEFFVNDADTASSTYSYNADGSSGMYLWGAQVASTSNRLVYTATTTPAYGTSANVRNAVSPNY